MGFPLTVDKQDFTTMPTKTITIQSDSLKRITKSASVAALAELIWNSLDAGATKIDVNYSQDILNQYIEVVDNGSGIKYSIADEYFDKLGGSWKSQKKVTDSNRPMHGEKGEGRFKAFSLGKTISWSTVYSDGSVKKGYSIEQSLDDIMNVTISDEAEVKSRKGTRVKISEFLDKTTKAAGLGSEENLIEKLTIIFAPYLIAYNNVSILVNKKVLDPATLLDGKPLIFDIESDGVIAELKLMLWAKAKDNQLYLCKGSTVLCPYIGSLSKRVKSFKQEYSAYLSSDFFNESSISLSEIDPCIVGLIEQAVLKMNELFMEKEKDRNRAVKDKWIEEHIYPYTIKNKEDLSETELVTRDVFDIVAIQVQEGIKKFKSSDVETRRLTFRLLAQALESNPKAIQKILNEVLNLNNEERDMFAELLGKMELTSIIQSAKVVADRLAFIHGLEYLLDEHKKDLREVDQLHKILEREVWLFDENFTLSVSDQNLVKVLEAHLNKLGKRSDDVVSTDIEGNHLKRTDLMLSRSIQIKDGYHEFLIVELKRPSVKIDRDIIGQLEDYAVAISKSPKFDKKKCHWKYIAVSNELADNALLRMEDATNGKIFMNDKSIEMYVMTWAEVINNAKSRLNFINEKLQYSAGDNEARNYLTKYHDQYLPESYLDQEVLN